MTDNLLQHHGAEGLRSGADVPGSKPSQKRTLSISEAARFLGVSAETLRRWDRKGILKPFRTKGRQRRYSLDVLESYKRGERKPAKLAISEAARHLGVHPETLRRWEKDGTVQPERTSGGQRRYSKEYLEKLFSKTELPPLQPEQKPQPEPAPSPIPSYARVPVRMPEHYRIEHRRHLLFLKRFAVVSLGVLLATIFWLEVPGLTKERLKRVFVPSPLNPIVDINDVAEYEIAGNVITRLKVRFPLETSSLVTKTLAVLGDSVLNTARFLGTVFLGSGNQYFLSPTGDGALRNLDVSDELTTSKLETPKLEAEQASINDATVDTLTVKNLNADKSSTEGTTSETFIIDTDDTGGDLSLIFGSANGEALTWDADASSFTLSDDLQTSDNITANQLISTAGIGTAPFLVSSTTKVSNLNADLLDSKDESMFATLSENEIISGDWDNTANPWSDAEVAEDLTITGGSINSTPIGQAIASDGAFTTLSSSGTTTLGNGTASVEVNSNDWKVSTLGVLTGISGITTDGGYTQTGTSANTFSGATTFTAAGTALTVNNDALVSGDLTVAGKVLTSEVENAGNITLDAINAAADSTVYILNSDPAFKANLNVEGDIDAGSVTFTDLTVTGTTDLQGDVLDTTGNLTLNDEVDVMGNLAVAGTTGATLSGAGAGVSFSGTGGHLISASAGTLQLGAFSLVGDITGSASPDITGIGQFSGTSFTDGTLNITGGSITGGIEASFSAKVTTPEVENSGDITLDAVNAAADSTIFLLNSDAVYQANLSVEGDITARDITGSAGSFTSLTVTGTSDLQGAVSDSLGNLQLTDTVEISENLLLTSATPVIDATNGSATLSINTATNRPVIFGAGLVTANNFTSSGAVITGGSIDGTPIGQATPAAGSFTTLTSSGTTTLGDGTASVEVNSNDWKVSTLGVLTGISGITTDGGYTQTGVSANTFSGASSFTAAGTALTVNNDALVSRDLSVSGKVLTSEVENSGDITLDAINAIADSTVFILNSDITYQANLSVEGDITAGDITGSAGSFSSLTVTGTTDLQGDVLDTTGNLTLNDTVDLTGDLNLTSAAPLIDASNGTATLSINTATNRPVIFGAGLVTANNFTSSGAVITGGSIDGTPIGAGTPSSGAFTTLSANSDVDFLFAGAENLGTSGTVSGTAGVDLISASLTNDTTSGNQRLLVLTNTGTGVTENGLLISNTGTGTTAMEISGTWGTGILTNNNSINAGTGSITSGAITASGALAVTSGGASVTGDFSLDGDLSFTGPQQITSSTGDLTVDTAGSLIIADAVDLNNILDIDAASALALTVGDGTSDTLVVDTVADSLTVTGGLSQLGGAATSFSGNVTLGDTSGDMITFYGLQNSNLVPAIHNSYDLGSPSNKYANIYAVNLIVESTSAEGTTANSFIINSDNATADLEDSNLEFERGTEVPNAIIRWDSAGDEFDFNFPANITSAAAQLKLSFDASNYMTAGVASDGTVTLNAAGTGAGFSFSDAVTVSAGNLTVSTGALTVSAGGASITGGLSTDSLTVSGTSTFNGISTFNTDADFTLAETENLSISNTATGTTGVDLISASLTNNTTSGTQRGLALTFNGSGVTDVGMILTYAGGGSATTALEIAGTWGTGILTNDNSINAGTGSITGGTGTFSELNLTGPLTITSSTTPQISVRFDASNRWDASVSAAGAVAFDAFGASAGFSFSDSLTAAAGATVGDRAGTDTFVMDALGTADGTFTTYDSNLLQFTASYWDGFAAQDITAGIFLDAVSTAPEYGLALQTAGSTRIFVDEGGFVGIGDSSPAAHLVVGSDAGANYANGVGDVYVQNDLEADGTIYAGTIILPSFTPGSVIFAGAGGTLAQDNINFFWDDTAKEIGIGTNTPGYKLEVVGDARVTTNLSFGTVGAYLAGGSQGGSIELGPANSGAGETPFIDLHYGVGTAQDYNYRVVNSGNNILEFKESTGGTTMVINAGQVGIGIGSVPEQRLHVGGNIAVTNNQAFMARNVGDTAYYELAKLDNTDLARYGNSTLNIDITLGEVGIGITNPTGKLQVVGGEVRIGNAGTVDYAAGDGDLYVEDVLEVDGASYLSGVTAGATSLSGNLTLLKTNTATSITQYPSYDAIFQGSGWDTTLVAPADLTGRLRVIAGSGATGSIPYRLGIFDNTPAEFVTFDLLNQRVGIGAASPGAKLDVRGGAVFNEDAANEDFRVEAVSNPYALWVDADYNTNRGAIFHNQWTSTTGQVELSTSGSLYGQVYLRSGFNAGSRRAFLRAAAAGQISLSLGDGLIGGDFVQYRTDAGAQQVYFDSDAAESVVGHTFYARLQVGSTAPIILQGDNATIASTVGNLTLDPIGSLVINSGTIDLSGQTVDVTLNNAVDALNFDSNTLSIDALNDSVGIGTTSPSQKLVVKGSASGDTGIFRLENDNTADGYNIFRKDSTGFLHFVGNQATYSGYRFFVNDATEVLTILNNGNVGIGTTAPGYKLHVNSSSAANPLYVSSGVYNNVAAFISTDDGAVLTLSDNDTNSYINAQNGYTSIGGANNLNATNLNINNTSGNVGIGTTAPRGKLDVVTSTTNGNNVSSYFGPNYSLTLAGRQDNDAAASILQNAFAEYNTTGAATYKWITTHASFGSRGIEFGYGATNGIKFYADSAATTANTAFTPTERMRITNAGNVGIGTTSPGGTLDVRGDAYFTSDSSVAITANARMSANAGTNDNLVLNGKGTGGIYLNWDKGTGGVHVGAGSTSEIFTILNSGNVGIGTTNPGTKLEVNGEVTLPSIKASTSLYNGTDINDAVAHKVFFKIPPGSGVPQYYKIARIKLLGTYAQSLLTGWINSSGTAQVGYEKTAYFTIKAYTQGTETTSFLNYSKQGENTSNIMVYKIDDGDGSGHDYYDVYVNTYWYSNAVGEITIIGKQYGNSAVTVWQTGLDSGSSPPSSGTLQVANANYNFDTTGNVGIGTTAPGAKLDVAGGAIRTDNQLISTVVTGTAPLSVASTTLVTNLNADLLDGYSWGNVPDGTDIWVNESGDTMTGTLTSSVGTGSNRFDWTGGAMRRMTDQGGFSLYSDSSVLFHAGDNGVTLISDLGITNATTTEILYLTADNAVKIITNRQTDYASSKTFTFATSGDLTIPGDLTVSGGDVTGIGGAAIDLGETASGDIYMTGDVDIAGHLAVGANGVIGTNNLIDIDETMSTNANTMGIRLEPTFNYTATANRTNYGLLALAQANTVNESTFNVDVRGIQGEVSVDGTSTLNDAWGGFFLVDQNSTTGQIDTAQAVRTDLQVALSTTITNGYGIYTNLTNSGTITNYYGLRIADVIEGTQTNAYAIYIDEGDVILDGDGNGIAGGTNAGSDLFFGEGRDAAIWYDGADLNIDPQIVGTGDLVVPNGNVGIGTTSPGYKLEVEGTANIDAGAYELDVLNTGLGVTSSGVYGGDDGTKKAVYHFGGAGADLRVGPSYVSDRDYIELQAGGTVSSVVTVNERLDISNSGGDITLSPSGNVGIGTTTPGTKLDVAGGPIRTDNQLISTVVTGTAPLSVASTTLVTNLNADLLDGRHGSGFLYYSTGGSLDVNSTPGYSQLYVGSSGTWTNRGPTGNNASALFSLNTHPGDYYSQIWFDTAGDTLYHRSKNAGAWRGWNEIWTSGNDGSGSGLDADLLDGWNLATASTGNTVVGRNGSGDINARLFRSEYDTTNATINYIMTQIDTVSNNYIRPSTPAQLVTGLGLEAGGSRDIWVEKAGDTMSGALSFGSSMLNELTPRFIVYDDSFNASYMTYGVDAVTRYKATSNFMWKSVPTGATRLSAAGTQTMVLDTAGNLTVGGNLTVSGRNIYLGSQRLYGDNNAYLNWYGNHSTTTGMQFRDLEGSLYGYVYGDGNGANFGLLNSAGGWRVRVDASNVELYGGVYMGTAYASILYDRNNTGYYVDPASGLSANFAGYIDATYFRDENNTGYYVDPASTSNLNAANFAGTVAANNGISVDGSTVIDNGAGWHRSYNATGWYNGTYGGGVWMDQSTYVRVYGGKGFTVPGSVGIGTTSPATNLALGDSSSTVASRSIRLYGYAAAATGYFEISASGNWAQLYNSRGNVAFKMGTDNQYQFLNSAGTVNTVIQASDGSVGIGTGTAIPNDKLEVNGRIRMSDSYGNTIFGSGPVCADDVYIRVQTTTNTGYGACTGYYYRSWAVGALYAAGAVRFSDIAEVMEVNPSENIQSGDVVSSDPVGNVTSNVLSKSRRAYDPQVVGVVSSPKTANMILGISGAQPEDVWETSDKKPISLAGKVLVNVTLSNGFIRKGDLITTNDIPGLAMKATKAGYIIGKALENYDPSLHDGQLLIFIDLSWYDPAVYLTDTGELNIEKVPGTDAFAVRDTQEDSIVERIGVFAETVVGSIKAGSIDVEELKLSSQTIDEYLKGYTDQVDSSMTELAQLKDRLDSLEIEVSILKSSGVEAPAGVLPAEGVFEKITATILATFKKLVAETAEIAEAVVENLTAVFIKAEKVEAEKITVDEVAVTDKTSGQAVVLAGEAEILITNPLITSTSKIFITFKDSYAPAVQYWVSETVIEDDPETEEIEVPGFTITLDAPVDADARFDYWIVN